MLGHTHVLIAGATWAAVWWRPIVGPDWQLAAPVVVPLGETPAQLPGPALLPALGGLDVATLVLTLALVCLGALLPDLDQPRATLAQWRPLSRGDHHGHHGWLGWLRPFLLPSLALRGTFGHRGGLHSLLAAVLIAMGLEALGRIVGVQGVGYAIGWGYGSHLLADLVTRRGVPLLWPLIRLRFGPPKALSITTGGWGEMLYLALIAAASAAWAVSGGPS